MRTEQKEIFTFDELSNEAKEKARDWYREGNLDWWDCTYADAKQVGAYMGIEIERIYFSGFSSQGDGACFEASYRYAKGGVKAVSDYAPRDAKLLRIAKALQDVQRRNFYRLYATTKQRGHYQHSGCMAVEVEDTENRYRDIGDAEDDVTQALRDFADWIYSQLEKEYDYLNSDESVDESIIANEYEFYENGKRA